MRSFHFVKYHAHKIYKCWNVIKCFRYTVVLKILWKSIQVIVDPQASFFPPTIIVILICSYLMKQTFYSLWPWLRRQGLPSPTQPPPTEAFTTDMADLDHWDPDHLSSSPAFTGKFHTRKSKVKRTWATIGQLIGQKCHWRSKSPPHPQLWCNSVQFLTMEKGKKGGLANAALLRELNLFGRQYGRTHALRHCTIKTNSHLSDEQLREG